MLGALNLRLMALHRQSLRSHMVREQWDFSLRFLRSNRVMQAPADHSRLDLPPTSTHTQTHTDTHTFSNSLLTLAFFSHSLQNWLVTLGKREGHAKCLCVCVCVCVWAREKKIFCYKAKFQTFKGAVRMRFRWNTVAIVVAFSQLSL